MNYWPAAKMNYSAYAEYGDPSAALTAYRWLRMTFYKEKHVTQNAPERMNSGAFWIIWFITGCRRG